jgi:hypothetical protein
LRWWWQALLWLFLWPLPLGFWAASLPRNRRIGPVLLAASSLAVWVAVVVTNGAAAPKSHEVAAGGTVSTAPSGNGRTGADGTPGSGQPTGTDAASSSTSSTRPDADPTATSTSTSTSTSGPTTTTSGPTAVTSRPHGTSTATSSTTTTTTAGPGGSGDDPTLILAGLRVAPEGPRTGYSRDLFPHWIDADGNRCDTREEVLIAESTSPAQVDPYGCKVISGDWFSLYDGLTTDDPSTFDIDHVVALAEAWDSGASNWTLERRRAFANDLDHPETLRAVSASSNRSKSDLDPAQWKPTRDAAWCQYARDWVTIKKTWDLTADPDEIADLKVMLRTCR